MADARVKAGANGKVTPSGPPPAVRSPPGPQSGRSLNLLSIGFFAILLTLLLLGLALEYHHRTLGRLVEPIIMFDEGVQALTRRDLTADHSQAMDAIRRL